MGASNLSRARPNRQALWRGDYPKRAKRLKQQATPATRCRRCGLTSAEAVRRWVAEGDSPRQAHQAAKWHAGHVDDGKPHSPLALEHARCNMAAGGRIGGRLRQQARNPVSPHAL